MAAGPVWPWCGPDRLLAGSHNTAAPAWATPDIGVPAGKGAGCKQVQATLRGFGRRLRRGYLGGSAGFQSCRHREPRGGRDAADPRGPDLSAETGMRIETATSTPMPTGPRRSSREADLACPLGPAPGRPYLDLAVLEQALVETGPTPRGSAGVSWLRTRRSPSCARRSASPSSGPARRRCASSVTRSARSCKIGAKLIAEQAGVPVAPWSRGEVASIDAALRGGALRGGALRGGAEIGYPMLKATAGGGGRDIRMVASAGDLTDAYERTSQEALRAFGSGVVFAERLVTGARHVEVQVIADARARRGRSASATARCSGATRRSSRSPPRRCSRPGRPPS